MVDKLFLDTNILRGMGRPKLAVLLDWSRQGRLHLVTSQWCLWELARQEYDEQSHPVINKDAQKKHIDPRDTRLAEFHYRCVHGTWEEAGADILMAQDLPANIAQGVLTEASCLFTKLHGNEERDKQIWLAVVLLLEAETNLTCYVADRNLRRALEVKGYNCATNLNRATLDGLSAHRPRMRLEYNVEADPAVVDGAFRSNVIRTDPKYAAWWQAESRELAPEKVRDTENLLAALEKEATNIRHAIMSMVFWLGGVSRDDLKARLAQSQFAEKDLEHYLDELIMAEILNAAGNLVLPDNKGHCESIAYQRIDDIEAILGAF